MGSALASTLPYAIAVIASPLSAIAVIALLISARGSRKALVFAGVWFVTCALAPLSLVPIVVLLPGLDGEDRLCQARAWLTRHNDDVQILTAVVFGPALTVNGLRTVLV
ncbi:hypothetical protein [Nocardiopsis synnemataformans]|uniref:hypothetical protein n=1 Tax=Nocardiopsis synnemataformans TaxID=61305 RepID=UPI003EBADC2C